MGVVEYGRDGTVKGSRAAAVTSRQGGGEMTDDGDLASKSVEGLAHQSAVTTR